MKRFVFSIILFLSLCLQARAIESRNAPLGALGDIEGQILRLRYFLDNSGLFQKNGSTYDLRPGKTFVFLGDVNDRGPEGRQVVEILLDLKTRFPQQVVLILGNRDLNKLKYISELSPAALEKTKNQFPSRAEKLKHLQSKLGAPAAFAYRQAELKASGFAYDDQATTQSFLDDLKPQGLFARYLEAGQLIYWDKPTGTVFMHGALTELNYGIIPGFSRSIDNPTDWMDRLNGWAKEQIELGINQTPSLNNAAASLLAYQQRGRGGEFNAYSVVDSRYETEDHLPHLPPADFIEKLKALGIRRVVVGHSDYGELPIVLRSLGFEFIFSDTSHSQNGLNPIVLISQSSSSLFANTESFGEVYFESPMDPQEMLGTRTKTNEIILGKNSKNDFILLTDRKNYQTQYRTVTAKELQAIRQYRCEQLYQGR